jgi:CHAT domain-containing protein
MGRLPRFLCLVLALWIVSLRPSAAFHAGSNDSGWSRGAKEEQNLSAAAKQYREAGDFARAEALYDRAYVLAQQRRDRRAAILYLSALGSCRRFQFQYRTALAAYLEAKELAQSIGDRLNLGGVLLNLSSLYLEGGDVDSALQAAEEARAAASTVPHPYYQAQLMLQLARLHESAGDDSAEPMLEDAIEAARSEGYNVLEAKAWSLLGEQRLQRGRLADAERAMNEAFRQRVLFVPQERGFSYGQLGALKLAQGDLNAAAAFTALSLRAGRQPGMSYPQYRLIHQRGRIKLARGNIEGALDDFRMAIDLAEAWRQETLPGISALDASDEALERNIFDSFIETAASEALRTGNSRWARESFQAMESNRFASLRESLTRGAASRRKLAPQYWDLLGKLRAEEARNLGLHSSDNTEAKRLTLEVAEMEAKAGLSDGVTTSNRGENFRSQSSLIHFQEGLGDSDLVLSFHLGESESYLWAVSRSTLTLYRLPPVERLRREVFDFGETVREGRAGAKQGGKQLYAELFGVLSRRETAKQHWLLSVEDALFELPFSALVTERKDGKVTYLVEDHSLQIVPGVIAGGQQQAVSNQPFSDRQAGVRPAWFLGVGDPIYNIADARWRPAAGSHLAFSLFAQTADERRQFNRLVGSAAEVDLSAQSWNSGSSTTVLLKGADAQREIFLAMLDRAPSVVHLATHVLSDFGERGDAFIVFGLGAGSEAEFLNTSEVAALHVPGSLIVMTGCETGKGETRAGTGLLGLTRAWLLAGAGAVLSTGWPVKDSNGEIFASFYRSLRDASAAEALRRSQVEMIGSGTWRAAPAYWASYQVTGGAH